MHMYVRMSNCLFGNNANATCVRGCQARCGPYWPPPRMGKNETRDACCIAGEHRHLHDTRPLLGPPWATVWRRLLRRARRWPLTNIAWDPVRMMLSCGP